MTEEEAQAWIADRFGEAASARLARFLGDVVAENARQNLISPATTSAMWSRHAVDSAQLLKLAADTWRTWLDIGTGGGFPGMVVTLLAPERRTIMVEPRRKRAEFLQRCMGAYALPNADVRAVRVEQVTVEADVISARAVASIENLLQAAKHCAKADTQWLLPRGRSATQELASLPPHRAQMFHVEHSLTDPESLILVATGSRL